MTRREASDGGVLPGAPHVLLERDAELAAIDALLASAAEGNGGALLFEGAAGTGKTSLLSAGMGRALTSGFRCLRADGNDLERGFPWGVALQLFGRLSRTTAPDELFVGAAKLARPLLVGGESPGTGSSDPFPLVHGLYWLTVTLAERGPLLVVIDDAQWSDPQTLRLLCYLLARLAQQPIAVLTAIRSGKAGDPEVAQLLARLATASRVQPVAPLSDASIRTLTRAWLPEASDAFCDAVTDVVGGNPFLCREVVVAVRDDQIASDADAAARLRELRPAGLHHSILVRLGQLGPQAAEVAAAVGALGSSARPHLVTRVTGLEPAAVAEALDRLVSAEVLEGSARLAFVHPVVQEVVLADLGEARLRRLHVRAARVLHRLGAGVEEVASHLLRGDPVEEDWAVEALREAARTAVGRGAPRRAAELLRMALDAAGDPGVRVAVLVELGRAEGAAGEPRAIERYRQALRRSPAAARDAALAAELGSALYGSGRFGEAITAFEHGLAVLASQPPERHDLVLEARLLAGIDMAGLLASRRPTRVVARLDDVLADDEAQASTGGRVLLAVAAGQFALGTAVDTTGAPVTHERVLELARLALTDDGLAPQLGPVVVEPLALALTFSDDFDAALRLLDRVLAEAGRLGLADAYASILPIRGLANLGRGRIGDAAADGDDAVRLAAEIPAASQQTVAAARYVLAVAHLERGELEQAADVVATPDAAERWGGSPLYGWYLQAVGLVALARGEHEEALAAFAHAGERFTAAGGPGAFCDWRSGAALALRGLGHHTDALARAEEELALAQQFGAPRGIAAALRTRAVVGRDVGEAITLLEEALLTVAPSQAVLERGRVEVELGAALRRHGQRRRARQHLRSGLALARGCGAQALVARAAEELQAAGARRPRMAITGFDALTPSELRVAKMAASGEGNREIAEALFVTRKTVESHLSNVYRKLDLSGRDELADALNRPTPGRPTAGAAEA